MRAGIVPEPHCNTISYGALGSHARTHAPSIKGSTRTLAVISKPPPPPFRLPPPPSPGDAHPVVPSTRLLVNVLINVVGRL